MDWPHFLKTLTRMEWFSTVFNIHCRAVNGDIIGLYWFLSTVGNPCGMISITCTTINTLMIMHCFRFSAKLQVSVSSQLKTGIMWCTYHHIHAVFAVTFTVASFIWALLKNDLYYSEYLNICFEFILPWVATTPEEKMYASVALFCCSLCSILHTCSCLDCQSCEQQSLSVVTLKVGCCSFFRATWLFRGRLWT